MMRTVSSFQAFHEIYTKLLSILQSGSRQLHLYDRAAVVINYSIVLGLSPVYISRKGKEPALVTDIRLHLISSMYLLIYYLLLYSMRGSIEAKKLLEMDNKFFMHVTIVHNAVKVIVCTVLTPWCFINRNLIKLLFESFAEVDIALREFGIKRCYIIEKLFLSICVFYKLMFYFGITIIQYLTTSIRITSWSSVALLSVNSYPHLVSSLAGIQQNLSGLAINRGFVDINSCLRKSIRKKDNGNNNSLTLEEVKLLMYIHGKLCETVLLMNTCFGAPIIVVTSLQLGYITNYLFSTLEATRSGDPMEAFCALSLTGITFFEVLLRLIGCHVTCNEMHKTKELVHKLILVEQSDPLIKKLVIFSRQLLHTKLYITVAGICPLDLTTLYWGIGVTTSMMIFLYGGNKFSACNL